MILKDLKGAFFISVVCMIITLHTSNPGNTIFYFDFKVITQHLQASRIAMEVATTSRHSALGL